MYSLTFAASALRHTASRIPAGAAPPARRRKLLEWRRRRAWSGSEMSDEHVPGKIVTHAGFLILPAALTLRLHGNVGTGSSNPK